MEPREHQERDEKDRSIRDRLDKLADEIRNLPEDRIYALEKLIDSMDRRVYTLKEAAKILGVHVDTVRRSIKAGKIKAVQMVKAGNWKIPREEIERFMRGGGE
ncbi:MAG: helix-turn-helix domain-containing protein [Chlamydiae bacterium]|nr:helix-turn-helix domain-containing protein [Chlamydiota bacterium]